MSPLGGGNQRAKQIAASMMDVGALESKSVTRPPRNTQTSY